MPTEDAKRRFYANRKREKIDWAEGERDALIAKALANGRAKQIDLGVSGQPNLPERKPR